MPGAFTTSGRKELYGGVHILVPVPANPRTVRDTLRIAFYTSAASINKDTTVYSTTNEVSGGGYTAGGNIIVPTFTDVVIATKTKLAIRFPDIEFTSMPTFVFRKGLLYNASVGKNNRAICYWEWDTDQTASGTTFSIGAQATIALSPIVIGEVTT